VLHLDLVARLDLIGRDVDPLAVDEDVAVGDELTGREHGGNELGPVDDGVETALEQADQGLAGVLLDAGGFRIELAERLLGDRAVVALELLLGTQLQAVIRGLALAALAVLAGAISTGIERGLRTTPD